LNQSNYLKSNIFESNNNLKHFFGNSDFTIPNNEKVFFLNQTHSDKVINIDNLKLSEVELNGDAIVTSKKDFYIGVKTADCVPILLGSTNSSFVAAVHSGWRGTFNKIIENVIEEVMGTYRCSKNEILCAIGPSIGMCCYEVGSSMLNKFSKKFVLEDDDFIKKDKKCFLDLGQINKKIVNKLGVSNVELIPTCTSCENNFFSYRRDGSRSNNQISIIKSIR
jgi:YfiH family protein